MGARFESDSMRRYYDLVHAAIHEGEEDFRDRIRAEVDPEYREHLADDFMERFETYPKMLRYSQVVAIANTIEHELRTLGSMCEDRVGQVYKDYNYTTQGWPKEFARIHDFLLAELGFQLPAGPDWEFLIDAFILRNAIAHFDGQTQALTNNQAGRALAFAAHQDNVTIAPMLMATDRLQVATTAVEVQPGFIADFFATWDRWLEQVKQHADVQGFELP